MNTTPTSAFTLDEVLKASWAMTKEHWLKYFGIIGATVLIYIVYGIAYGILDAIIGLPEVVQSILSFFVGVYVSLIMAKGVLSVSRGGKPTFSELVKFSGKTYLQALLATFLFYLAVMVGLVLLIIPGIIAAVALCFYIYSIVDKDAEAIPSLEDSLAMTKGNRLTIFLFNLVIGLIAVAAIGIPAVISFVVSLGAASESNLGPILGAGIVVIAIAVVVSVVLGLVSMSGQAYMYNKMRAKTPFVTKK
jgi:hypothetical protein